MKIIKEKLTCHKCGASCDFTRYPNINITLNPELKYAVLTGKIFENTCPNCGHLGGVYYDMLYHDTENKFMVQFTDRKSIPDYEKSFTEHKELTANAFSEDYTVRYVEDVWDLSTTITSFENNRDDRIVKLILAEHLNQKQPQKDLYNALLVNTENGLAIALFYLDGEMSGISFPQGWYDELTKLAKFDHDGNHSLVDLYWLAEHLVKDKE